MQITINDKTPSTVTLDQLQRSSGTIHFQVKPTGVIYVRKRGKADLSGNRYEVVEVESGMAMLFGGCEEVYPIRIDSIEATRT